MRRNPGPRRRPGLIVSGAVAWPGLMLPVTAPGTAWAHGEESDESEVLVEQAVALVVSGELARGRAQRRTQRP